MSNTQAAHSALLPSCSASDNMPPLAGHASCLCWSLHCVSEAQHEYIFYLGFRVSSRALSVKRESLVSNTQAAQHFCQAVQPLTRGLLELTMRAVGAGPCIVCVKLRNLPSWPCKLIVLVPAMYLKLSSSLVLSMKRKPCEQHTGYTLKTFARLVSSTSIVPCSWPNLTVLEPLQTRALHQLSCRQAICVCVST